MATYSYAPRQPPPVKIENERSDGPSVAPMPQLACSQFVCLDSR